MSIGKNTKMGSEVFTPATAEKAILDLTQSGLSQRLFLIVKGSQRTSGCVGSRPYLVILREPPTATHLAPHEGVAPAVDGSKIAFEVAHSRDPNPTNPCSDVMSGWRVEDYPIT
jgi:hypothetical protein